MHSFAHLAFVNLTAALLVFSVQPMVAKMALPLLGGAAMVWLTALMFFQGGLFLAYAYAHVLATRLSFRRQRQVHLAVVVGALALLPVAIPDSLPDAPPSLALLAVLALSVGLPYFVVCTTSPLTQRWYADRNAGVGRSPYLLYSVSNAGSMSALIAYPLLIEPYLSTDWQSRVWSGGFVLLGLALAGFLLFQRVVDHQTPPIQAAPAAAGDRARWVTFAFVPSLYLMGVTLHISTDIAAAPFLWVVPLALYLATFMIVFARPSLGTSRWVLEGHAAVAIFLAIYFHYGASVFLVSLHLVGLFLACMVSHGRLVQSRPAHAGITEFYLWVSLGGWLGGICGAIVAPLVFDGNREYVIAIIAACLLRPTLSERPYWRDFLWPLALGVAVALLLTLELDGRTESYLVFFLLLTALYWFRTRPVCFALGILSVFAGDFMTDTSLVQFADRGFYGIYEVRENEAGKVRYLSHGTTIHGAQAVDPRFEQLPIGYYDPEGPVGQLLIARRHEDTLGRFGVVGLGAGALACYAGPRTQVTFFEIDPLVAAIAREQFHYLKRCTPNARIVIGDGRLALAAEDAETFDVLVLDAFSSDAVPVHLLTVQALRTYLDKLAPGGVVLFNVSNRFVDLRPVIASIAAANGTMAWYASYVADEVAIDRGGLDADWALVAKEPGNRPPGWLPLTLGPPSSRWTDTYSNLFSVIDWSRVLLQ